MPSQKFIDLYSKETYHAWGNLDPNTGEPFLPIVTLEEEPELKLTEQELVDSYRWQLQMIVNHLLWKSHKPAFTLSSGLDSSAILFIADHVFGIPQQAFSVVYEGDDCDESEAIKEMLGNTVKRWHPIKIVKPDVRAILKEMISLWKEPVPTVTWMSHYLLCKEVAKLGFKSLFHGMGSDELNAGEYEFFPYFFDDLYGKTLANEIRCWKRLHSTPRYPKNKASLLWQEGPFRSSLKNRLYRALNEQTVPCCLHAIEKNTQVFGLESYAPYLDKDLIRFMFCVPNHMKIRNGVMKWLHREAMKGILPEKTRANPTKTGWNAPLDLWLPETQGMIDREKMLYWQNLNLEIWLNR